MRVVGFKPAPTMEDDAAFIASDASKLISQGEYVLRFAYSYGGVPATESTKGL